jgi:hypothetical protein
LPRKEKRLNFGAFGTGVEALQRVQGRSVSPGVPKRVQTSEEGWAVAMTRYYNVEASDGELLPCVFKEMVDGKLVVRKRYKKYTCTRCGRVDACAALSTVGLDPAFQVSPGTREFCITCDYLYVVSDKVRSIIEGNCDDVLFYEIQNSDNLVIWPKVIVIPDASKAYQRTRKCAACNAYRSIVFGPEAIQSIPDVSMAVVLLEGPQGPMPAWFANESMAKVLKASKIKGLTLIRR